MFGYICFYKDKRLEVYANSSREAQSKAALIFKVKPKKTFEVSVYLAEDSQGNPVIHRMVD